jgi:hypothetical protein
MKRMVTVLCLSVILSIIVVIPTYAQGVTAKIPVTKGPVMQINKYFSTQTTTYSDGKILNRSMIKGPRVPPPGYELKRTLVSLPEPNSEMGINTLAGVPAFNWVFGCSAVSGAMVAGYYDRSGFPNIYTGPTDGGVMPLTEHDSWGEWTDSEPYTYPNNPLVASHDGLDGRNERGSIDDYWIKYGSAFDDPYITEGWLQHTWGDAIGDFMKTSQSEYGNVDGSTAFYSFTNSPEQLTCADMESYGISHIDGTYGRKLFYEARGYTVTDCYAQNTDNNITGGFSFAQYKAEIDAGHPVLLNLDGHSIVGIGYDDSISPQTLYIHDTWDNGSHTMDWGGSYSGMELLSVSVVNLQGPTSPCGNGYCGDDGEDCHTCPEDCISNDSGCGNGVCEPDKGEDCLSCPYDCAGNQVGKPSKRFCCGDGDGVNAVGCEDSRCSSGGFSCGQSAPYCCGDGECTGAEDQCNCAGDCGSPKSSETGLCHDGIDNDCDGLIDCDDSEDCEADSACQCTPTGDPCSSGAECCSGLCHPVKGVCK